MTGDNAVSPNPCTKQDFCDFLERLSPDLPEAGKIYIQTRQKLVFFFESYPEAARFSAELADETMDRIVRLGSKEEKIKSIHAFARAIANYVLKEFWKQRVAETLVAEVPEPPQYSEEPDQRLLHLEHCLSKLPAKDRDVILSYHESKGKQKIAAHRSATAMLDLSPGAFRIRIHRIRQKLETCVQLAMKNSASNNFDKRPTSI